MDYIGEFLKLPGTNVILGSDSLIFQVPSVELANELINGADQLAQAAANFRVSQVEVVWQDCPRPLRVLASMAEPSDEQTLSTVEKVLSGPDDLNDMRILEELLLPRQMRALVELESDDAVMASRTLLQRIGQTSSEYRHDNMRRYWNNDKQISSAVAAEDLVQIKKSLRQGSSIDDRQYRAWLNDLEFCQYRSDFKVVEFQGVICHLVAINEITPASIVV